MPDTTTAPLKPVFTDCGRVVAIAAVAAEPSPDAPFQWQLGLRGRRQPPDKRQDQSAEPRFADQIQAREPACWGTLI